MADDQLIYDWNQRRRDSLLGATPITVVDETLRDGVQSPSVEDPSLDDKKTLVRMMDRMGIGVVDVGLPGAGQRARDQDMALDEMSRDEGLSIIPNCAARTLEADIAPVAEIQQATGHPVEVYTFIGSSPVRQFTENWTVESIAETSRKAVEFATRNNLSVAYVTEDTTRSRPDQLTVLFNTAIEAGAKRIVLCDTCGHATPHGVDQLVRWALDYVEGEGSGIGVDWHGHNDRGLSLPNALVAAEAGAGRIHGTALGVGERVGNTPVDQLLVNLKLLGLWSHDLSELGDFVRLAASACKVPLPYNYPVFGADAFRTATGVHAAAIVKALERGDKALADLVYSGVPAGEFGMEQVIEIGPMSGMSNVRYWCSRRGIEATPSLTQAIFAAAKSSERILTNAELDAVVSATASHV
jgi:2-isopropylmalate synthase